MQKRFSKHFLVKFTVFCKKGSKGSVQHFTVSSTLLCPAYYCVQQNTVSTLTQRFICSPFTCQHAAVVSSCACEAPELNMSNQFWKGHVWCHRWQLNSLRLKISNWLTVFPGKFCTVFVPIDSATGNDQNDFVVQICILFCKYNFYHLTRDTHNLSDQSRTHHFLCYSWIFPFDTWSVK